ncbi:MAG: hypothetical protein EA392_01730 [Cryomorphaceae bacterium]|nr:MAG: hypothetical protein EA392_01730 [Cryomorphaceae bacterium]
MQKSMNRFIGVLAPLLLAVLMMASCKKENDRTNWNVDVLAPLLYTSLTLENIIPDSLLSYDENELVYLSYSDTILRFNLDTLIQIPDTAIVESFSMPIGLPNAPPGAQITNIQDEIMLNANNVELRKAVIREGIIQVKVTSTFEAPILCTYSIPSAKLNGTPLEIEVVIPGSSEFLLPVDVSNYEIDLTTGSQPFNRIPTVLTVRTDPNGGNVALSIGQGFELETSFIGVIPRFAEGYFGQQTSSSGPEVEQFNAFNIIESGSIDLEQVYVNLEIRNGVGVDIRANIHEFNAINSQTGANIGLNHSILQTPVNLNRATYSGSQINYSSYTVELDHTNSDIKQMLESFPNAISVAADLELNPLGNVSNHHDFAFDNSTIEGLIDVNIPLCLIAEELQLADTSDFSVGEDDALQNVNSGKLTLQLTNGFPLEGWLGLIAINGDEGTVLLNDGHFPAAITNAENVVIAPVSQQINITLDAGQMEKLRNATQLSIRARFSTTGLTQHVKLYRHYKLDAKLIADFNYHVNN